MEERVAAEGERELLDKARRGDRAAFEALVTDAFASLYRFCSSLAGRNRADDLVQEAILRALGSIERFRGEARFRSWLFTIARNAHLNEAARLRSKLERGDDEVIAAREGGDPSPLALAARKELRELLEAAIEELPEEQRTAILLCDREGMSYKEIAEVMGTPIGTVMSRIHYARTRLKKRLGHLGEV